MYIDLYQIISVNKSNPAHELQVVGPRDAKEGLEVLGISGKP